MLYVDRLASVQFGGDRALIFRVIKVCEQPTYHGWIWLTGYVLDRAGNARDRREIYVQAAGLIRAAPPLAAARQPSRKTPARTTRNAVRQ
ncbi:hypothetical protein [Micromonospora sp. NPDC048830]|uniref:hypothetical protein n=1 Tax=Micromonospora sp. NPDC048830 TaxID=3364257 RepID=UPI003724BFFE